jgi:hypothetical protein
MNEQDYRRIIWLASYPKSGNTWFRAFLANLSQNSDQPADINELEGSPIASSRLLFDEATGLSSSDLTQEEIENLRPQVYTYIANNAKDVIFHKIHDAYTYTSEGCALVPESATKAVIYFVRNPLDVAVSFAHHANLGFESIVKFMNDNNYAFCSKSTKLHMQLMQRLLSWSNHAQSWVDNSRLPIHVVRYEDMMINPLATFMEAIQFCGFKFTMSQIENAILKSSFNELQKQENEKGFREKSPESIRFFRKGKIGSWKEELPLELVNQIICDHRGMMTRFGYLTENGNLID